MMHEMNDKNKLEAVQEKLKELWGFAKEQDTRECLFIAQNIAVLLGASYAEALPNLSQMTGDFANAEIARLKAPLN